MRNLKKILALVLALMMTLSMMVTANAASKYSDADQIDGKYDEAVEVLTGLGVYWGTDATANTFNPKANITRAEVSALVYRIISGDTNDKQNGIYADYNKFSDVRSNTWYAGYVNYAANGQYILGDGQGRFYPFSNVTGYEVLAIMLRAIGYGKNAEFEGAGWQVRVATLAKELHITDTVESTVTLGKAVSREVVAELLFRALTKTPTVTYTPALGYSQNSSISGNAKNPNLGIKTFNLHSTQVGQATGIDMWGRPGYYWYQYKHNVPANGYTSEGAIPTPVTVTGKPANSTAVATINLKPDATFTVGTTECDIAKAIDLETDKDFNVYVNGFNSVNTTGKIGYKVQPRDTVNKLGGQGVLLEVYNYNIKHANDANARPVIVHIDTFLAQVESVRNATMDKNGHLITPSSITLRVFDTTTNDAGNAAGYTKVTLTNGSTNYTYAQNDMVLVSVPTNNGVTTGTGVPVINKAIATTNGTYSNNGEIQGLAPTVSGAQTVINTNAKRHTVGGTAYNDNEQYHLDEAQRLTRTFTWYLDNYGNMIGSTRINTTKAYATIERIQWNPVFSAELNSDGYAWALLRYMDGTTEFATVKSINDHRRGDPAVLTENDKNNGVSDYAHGGVSQTLANNYWDSTATGDAANVGFTGRHLYEVNKLENGVVELEHVNKLTTTTTGGTTTTTYSNNQLDSASNSANKVVFTANGTNITVNNSTSFMVRSGNGATATYTSFTGIGQLNKYDNAVVDYVDADNNGVAEYVYIIGTTAAVTTSRALVWITSNDVTIKNGTDQLQHYYVEGYVNGVLNSEIEVDKQETAEALASGKYTMFAVEMADGVIKTVAPATNDATTDSPYQILPAAFAGALKTVYGIVGTYENLNGYGRVGSTGTDNILTLNGGVLAETGNTTNTFTVNDSTVILCGNADSVDVVTDQATVGDQGDLTKYNVYVLYNTANEVVALYYALPANTGNDSTLP